MSIQELERAVIELSPDQYKQFTRWLAQHDSERWDQQIKSEAEAANPDTHIAEAQRNFDREQAAEWRSASLRSLQEVWDNDEDAIYDRL